MSSPGVVPAEPVKKEFNWKRLFIKAAGFGAGCAVILVLCTLAINWYSSRPKPPKPWNTSAIKAEYLGIAVQPEETIVQVGYILENTTETDYEISSLEDVKLAMQMGDKHALSPFNEYTTFDVPVFVPAKHKIHFDIHLKMNPPKILKHGATDEERASARKATIDYLNTNMTGLGGFVLLDEKTRYEINFPDGWKNTQTPAK